LVTVVRDFRTPNPKGLTLFALLLLPRIVGLRSIAHAQTVEPENVSAIFL